MTDRDRTSEGRIARCRAAAPGLLVVLGFAIPALAALDQAAVPQQGGKLAWSEAVQFAQAGQGRVSSVLFHDLPPGFPVEVISFDDTEADLEIRGRFEEELQKAGHLVAGGAPLELSFTAEVMQGDLATRQPSLGRIGGGSEHDKGNRGSDTGVDVELNVWSSTQDSVLGGRQSRGGGGGARYHMTAQLRDRESGRVLWQGDAYCEMQGSDRLRLARSMVRPLVGAYGRSVKDEPFTIE
ncbi:MAG: hypothetical protein ACFCUQ_10250 [Kiloniellales bacterium]